jgi:hypothetical protein
MEQGLSKKTALLKRRLEIIPVLWLCPENDVAEALKLRRER